MSASSIPHLLSLRDGTQARGSRSRNQAGGTASSRTAYSSTEDIQSTDVDAAVSRLSAVHAGYLHDEFAKYFVPPAAGSPLRRLPIINRGTYARTIALDRLVAKFLFSSPAQYPEKQIVSLGAGTDTRSLRLFSRADTRPPGLTLFYHEVDFPLVCDKKLRVVRAEPALRDVLQTPTDDDLEPGSWSAAPRYGPGRYWCHGMDLRLLPDQPVTSLTRALRHDIPTLLISECCLCYLEPPVVATAVVTWFTTRLSDIALALYEPISPNDAFGRVMVANFASRHIYLPSLQLYCRPADQEHRLHTEIGFRHAAATTIDRIWDRWVSPRERDRVDALEGLDELEEWNLLASHYVVAWGWTGHGFDQFDDGLEHLPTDPP